MKNTMIFLAVVSTMFVSGCATQLDPGADKVRFVTAQQKDHCETLGMISVDQEQGLNKASNALNKVINEVARRGGNAVFLMTTRTSGVDGAAVMADALRCK